jgi:small ligand-binding sensory domain FIST
MIRVVSNNAKEVATGVAYGAFASEDHIAAAVKSAMRKLDEARITSVLLFLSHGYAHQPQKAIKRAAQAAGTFQIYGCCAAGLIADNDWLLDTEGAVAMVFSGSLSLQSNELLINQDIPKELLITLSSPNAAGLAINAAPATQVGGITSDIYGDGPHSIWQSGHIVEREYSHIGCIGSTSHHVKVAHGIKRISPNYQINRVENNLLQQLNQQSATENLLSALSNEMQSQIRDKPYDLLCAISSSTNPRSLDRGEFELINVLSLNETTETLTLAKPVNAGRHLFWATRDKNAAKKAMAQQLDAVQANQSRSPKFALMFSSMTRGPMLLDGKNQDLHLFNTLFPTVPLAGFYTNGEISHRKDGNPLINQHSSTIAVFY